MERYAHRLGRFNYMGAWRNSGLMAYGMVTSVKKSDELGPRSIAMMEFAAEMLWLLYYNNCAYKQGVISEQIYRRMDLAIRTRKQTWKEVKDS